MISHPHFHLRLLFYGTGFIPANGAAIDLKTPQAYTVVQEIYNGKRLHHLGIIPVSRCSVFHA